MKFDHLSTIIEFHTHSHYIYFVMSKASRFWNTLYRYKAHHLLLWIGYFVFWMIPYRNLYPFQLLLWTTFQYFVFNAIAFYVTSYFLIPVLFQKRKFTQFFTFLILVIVTLSIGLAFCLYFTFKDIEGTIEIGRIGYFWMAFMSVSMMTAVLSGAKLMLDNIRSARKTKILEQQRLESELQYLKAQVNPHFLFNAINSVYILIRKDPEKAAETLIKLSDLLRFQLYETSDNQITIEKELEYLKNYIELEKLRRGEKIKFELSLDNNLQGFQIAPFLLMPLLENTFKHVSHHDNNKIIVTLSRDNGQLKASFYNTIDDEPSAGIGGIGLKNLKRRLDLIYPDAYALVSEKNKDHFKTTLTIPVS